MPAEGARAREEWVRAHIWQLEEEAVQALYGLFLDSYGELSQRLVMTFMNQVPGAGNAWSTTDPGYRSRTEVLLDQIDRAVIELLGASADLAMDAAWRAYQAGAYGRGWVLDQALPPGDDLFGMGGTPSMVLPLLPAEAIRAALLLPYEGLTLTDRFANARAEFEMAVRGAIVQSQILGEGIPAAMRRLAAVLGVGPTPTGLLARIEMIARTEILRASNQGALAIYQANPDVLDGWEWIATKDERTCPTCGALDGRRFGFDSRQPAPPAHPRCRCSVLPVLRDAALAEEIAGTRETYSQWAAAHGIGAAIDGGVFDGHARETAPAWA